MPIKKFTDEHKAFLMEEFGAKRISLSESGNAVRDRYMENFSDISKDLFTKRFKECKEEFVNRGHHREF